ncbi:hypothetical protein [Marinobacter adhaerens]|uniref:hypothetical protein n=1 Tax=Marinobacter adhaerens TaxID=1033846 RepID=UPI001C56C47B|nr:hypothetical protein [Marinobacter adhaerens]MBW3225498.1 hypothetical protein [Marinobacter adhaerens]
MNKFSNRLTDCRSRLLDAEATLNFLRNRENLNNLLEHDSPDVVLEALIDQAWTLVFNASGDCEAMTEASDEDLRAELQATVREVTQPETEETADPAIRHFDALDEIHAQTDSLLSMLFLYFGQLGPEGEELHPHIVQNYLWQLQNNMKRAQEVSNALYECKK